MNLAIRYIFFSVISIFINICTQVLIFQIINSRDIIYIALFFGTITGLLSKYFLDKHWIFMYEAKNKRDDFTKFFMYSLMGLATTTIFWLTEWYFYTTFNFYGSQYIGGIIGLSIGYTIKYQLDKYFVFR
tara:strand:+ start:124 stop:513 length:390 start_codon:yes stop_codon:yes gene_type:complete